MVKMEVEVGWEMERNEWVWNRMKIGKWGIWDLVDGVDVRKGGKSLRILRNKI